jgi:hypothetical protein
MGQLNAAARNPWMVATFDGQHRVGGEPIAGLVDPPIACINKPGEDQRLRPGPALRQPALDQQLIDPLLRQQSETSYARAGCSAISRPSADKAIATMWRALSPA